MTQLTCLVAPPERQWLVRQRVATRNRLHGVLRTLNLTPSTGDPFSMDNRDWWHALPLASPIRLRLRHDLVLLDHLSALIREAEDELARLSVSEPWAEQVPFLMQLSGFGLRNAMTLLSAVGTVTSFPTPKQLVGYSGPWSRVILPGRLTALAGSPSRGALNCVSS